MNTTRPDVAPSTTAWQHLSASGRAKFSALRRVILLEQPSRHRPRLWTECYCQQREFIYFAPRSCTAPDLDALEPDEWSEAFNDELHRFLKFLQIMGVEHKLFVIHQALDDAIRDRNAVEQTAPPWTVEADITRARCAVAAGYGFPSESAADYAVSIIWSVEGHKSWDVVCLKPHTMAHGSNRMRQECVEDSIGYHAALLSPSYLAACLYEDFLKNPAVHTFDEEHGCICLKALNVAGRGMMEELLGFRYPSDKANETLRSTRQSLVPDLVASFRLFHWKFLWPYAHCAIRCAMLDRIQRGIDRILDPQMFLLHSEDLVKVTANFESM